MTKIKLYITAITTIFFMGGCQTMDGKMLEQAENEYFDRIDGLKHHSTYQCGPVEYKIYYQPKIPQSYTSSNEMNEKYRFVTSVHWQGTLDVKHKRTSFIGPFFRNTSVFDTYGNKFEISEPLLYGPLKPIEYEKIPNGYLFGFLMDNVFKRSEKLPLGTYTLKFKPSEFLTVNGTPCLIATPDMKVEIVAD